MTILHIIHIIRVIVKYSKRTANSGVYDFEMRSLSSRRIPTMKFRLTCLRLMHYTVNNLQC